MSQIFIHVTGVVLAALIVKLLRLNTKKVIISQSKPISWVWKLMVLIGKITFFYGLLVCLAGIADPSNVALGISVVAMSLFLWSWGGLVIYFKRN